MKISPELVDLVSSELTYSPSVDQRKLKSAFWARFADNPLCDPSEVSVAVIVKLVPDTRISRWWSVNGFREWFTNQSEFRDRIEYLSYLILDSLEEVIMDPKANPNAKVNAAKLIMEAARKMPKKAVEPRLLDEKVAEMDKRELEQYIEKQMRRLPSGVPPQTNPPSTILPEDK